MKKKLIVTLLVLASCMAGLFATPLIQLGANFAYNAPVGDGDAFVDGLGDFDNYSIGAEARINFFDWVSLVVPATFGGLGSDLFSINTTPSINLNIPAASVLDIALGLGMRMNFSQIGDDWYLNGYPMGEAGEAFLGASLAYRAALTFNVLGLGIGLTASVPTGSFNDFSMMPQWEQTALSASLMLNLF